MNVLAVDPSFSCTGVAKIAQAGVILTDRIRTSPEAEHTLGSTRRRLRLIVTTILRFAPDDCLTIIESPIVIRGGKGGAQLERGALFWMLIDQLMARGPIVAIDPRTRAKYATGNGNAGKPAVLAAMRETHPLLQIPDDNVADALALLGMGSRALGHPIDGDLSKKHLMAMTSPAWPSFEGNTK